MLLIGDIHINAKQTNAILTELKNFVGRFPDEKNIIFLGDYMYMFSYDRQALAELFDIFLQLWRDGKNVYIVGGNHDRLSQHFIYHEGKKVADILYHSGKNNTPTNLHFIVEPATYTIEGQQIFFMPYNKGFLSNLLENYRSSTGTDTVEYTGKNTQRIGENTNHIDNGIFSTTLKYTSTTAQTIYRDSLTLLQSTNYNEKLSATVNLYLLDHYDPAQQTLIHHYYTADTKFPGQDAQYDYKDIALHPLWTKHASRSISGHIHKSFVYNNYLCTGSLRYTTSGERDHCKRLWQRDTINDTFHAHEISINPYITITPQQTTSLETIIQQMKTVQQQHISLLQNPHNGGEIKISFAPLDTYDLANTTLLYYTTQSVSDIQQLLPDEIKQHVGNIQLKQLASDHKDMTELLDITQYNVKESLLDRKELVKKYIMSRYGTESEKYRTLLSELGIL